MNEQLNSEKKPLSSEFKRMSYTKKLGIALFCVLSGAALFEGYNSVTTQTRVGAKAKSEKPTFDENGRYIQTLYEITSPDRTDMVVNEPSLYKTPEEQEQIKLMLEHCNCLTLKIAGHPFFGPPNIINAKCEGTKP